MSLNLHRVWAEISLDNLVYNYREAKNKAAPSSVMPVIKADAYGHGAVAVAKALSGAGAEHFAVTAPEEALQLRRHGITQPLLMLGMTSPGWVPILADNGVVLTVGDMASAKAYAEVLGKQQARIHIKIETGMGRIGLRAETAVAEALEIAAMPCFAVEGIFTHFSAADDAREDAFTERQLQLYNSVVAELEAAGLHIPACHCSNSAALLAHPEARANIVRPGIMLFGCNPGDGPTIDLRPVMALRAGIVQVRHMRQGESVGYGRAWQAGGDAVIATVSIGYADGLPRSLSGRCAMLVRGKKAPQVGRICMDMCMLDVTGIPDVRPGDTATVFGEDGGARIAVEELAKAAGTIPYELLCAVGPRVTRIYYRNGNVAEKTCYIDKL